jgi:hypothetical protein
MKNPKNTPLRCRVSKGVLTIEIGIDTLKSAAERCEDFWQPQTDKFALVVKSPLVFARDVRNELLQEDEQGSHKIHLLLDEAILGAVEQGSEGLDYDAMEAIEKAEAVEARGEDLPESESADGT